MKAKTFSKILCLMIVVLSCAVLGLVFPTISQTTVYAATYGNFLSYNGSAHNFKADVYYPSSVTTTYAVENFEIRLYSTELTWSIFGPYIRDLKLTMTRPDGSTKEYTLKHQGLISDHFEEVLFTSDALKDGNGNVIEGEYKVQSSGYMTVDFQADQQQNRSFTFYVNLSAPSVVLQTVGGEISNNDITSKEVTVIASDKDCTPSLSYSRSTNSSYPSSAATSFTSGKTFSDEGNYIVTAKDGGGKTTTKRFAIDKTAPTLTLTGVSNGGYTSKNVAISWDTTIGGVGSQRVNSNDTLTVRYSRTTGSTFPTSASTTLSNGRTLSNEGNYFVTIQDSAGNRSSYSFTIDKTAPKLDINGLITQEATKDGFSLKWSTDIGAGKNKANDSDTLTIKYSRATSSYPSSAATTYSKQNTFLSDEGYYYITIEDRTGNRSIYRVIVDQTAPTVKAPSEYLNTSFVYSAEDPRGVTIEYRFNSGETTELSNTSFTVSFSAENYGVWEFRAIDDVGNTTSWSTVKFFYRDTFGNKENIQNSYKTPAYWTVQLSSKNFPDISGKYSFASYESALAFATAKEWEYRVVELTGGKWSYVNISNESVTQIYDNRDDLDRAINKYATSYISSRQVLGTSGSTYPNPTDDEGTTRPDALTEQNLILPSHLSQYSGLPLYFLSHDFKFVTPVAGVSGNMRKVVFKYISNGISAQDGEDLTITYDTNIQTVLDGLGSWKQGYYLVTESDLCGNIERYIVCIDTQLPTLTAKAYYGNGTEKEIQFDQGYVTENAGVMLYVGLDLNSLADNLDEFVMILISGRGMGNAQYLNSDELPYLTYENGYWGIYTLTVYDRSLNALTFEIKVAGAPATLKHTSLTNETRCTLTIESSDPYNAITEILLYKVSYTGEYIQMSEDGDGTPISAVTLSYVLRTGGKYVMRYTDIFGRTIETEPIFYMKGLPTGILKGVRENGITNKDVTFEYSSANEVELYVWQDGAWVLNNSLMTITSKEGYNIADITAGVETSHLYKFFLFVAEDKNLFVEYRFEIDCIAPSVTIKTEEGEDVTAETVINKAFLVNWDEYGLTAYYYNRNSSLGELGQSKYTKETMITTAGTWVFSVYDEVGNSISFTVTLDNAVTYTLDGTFSQLDDGSYIARNYLILSVTEPVTKWIVESTNEIKPTNGQKIDVDGTYKFTIADRYGNELVIVLIIDNLPPVPIVETEGGGEPVTLNGKINTSFTVSCAENEVSIMVSLNGVSYSPYKGEALSDEGTYTFKMTDRMNNITTFTITIDKKIDYALKGTYVTQEGKVYSRTGVVVNINEQYESWTVRNSAGISFEPGEKINIEGEYIIEIEDSAGNQIIIEIVIDHTAPTPKIQTSDGESVELNGKTKQSFFVGCDESNVTMLYSDVNSNYKPYSGELLEVAGKYYFTLRDFVGNEISFTVTIDKNVGFTIDGNYKIDSEGRYVSRSWLSIEMSEDYNRFEVISGVKDFLPGERVTLEGEYCVEIEDQAGNQARVVLVIDQAAPIAEILTADGEIVEPNSTINRAFEVHSEEAGVTIMIAGKDLKYTLYDGAARSAEAIYNFMLTDFIGNTSTFSIRIDLTVGFNLRGTYTQTEDNSYVTRSNFVIEADEDLSYYSITSSSGDNFELGDRLILEDEYIAILEDLYGNRIELLLVIDKTPPTITLSGVDAAGTTNGDVEINIEGGAVAYYRISGQETENTITNSVTVSENGYYTVSAKDLAGNETTVSFSIDKIVEATLSKEIIDKQILSESLSFKWNEQISNIVLTKDGAEIAYKTGSISEPGNYVLTVQDVPGNTRTWEWTILPSISQSYSFEVPAGFTVSVLCNGNVYSEAVKDNKINLTQSGEYSLSFEGQSGEYLLTLVVDTVAPTVSITQEKNQVVIGAADKNDVTYQLLKDGKEVAFSPGQAITENGNYVLYVTDSLGNQTQYSFTLNYINTFGILVIVIAAILIVGSTGLILYSRSHQRIK